MTANWLSNGLGGQSMFLLSLAAAGEIPATLSITADTGSENDRVCSTGERMTAHDFFHRFVEPYASKHNLEAILVRSVEYFPTPNCSHCGSLVGPHCGNYAANNIDRLTMRHTYKGYTIKSWNGPYGSFPDRGEPRYYIQTQHETGIDWSPENCPKAWSLREAKEKINEITKQHRAVEKHVKPEVCLDAGDHSELALALAHDNYTLLRKEWCRCKPAEAPAFDQAYWRNAETGSHGWMCVVCRGITQVG